MEQNALTDADDFLIHQATIPMSRSGNGEKNWFDRFYFNIHDADGDFLVLIGGAIYPNVGVVDGFVCVGRPGKQTNVRFARHVRPFERMVREIGPLRFTVLNPLSQWKLTMPEVEGGISIDIEATGRLVPFNFEPITVDHQDGAPTAFAHFIQPMRYDGEARIDGSTWKADGWLGQRDRSWGVRRTRESLGMHIWFSAQFESGTIAFNYNETRDYRLSHCDGAYLRASGRNLRVLDVAHVIDCNLAAGGRVRTAHFIIRLEDGSRMKVNVTGRQAAVQLAGAGYDGRHGTPPEGRELEIEHWDVTDSELLAGLPFRVINQCAAFDLEGEKGHGVLEFGLSRSRSYTYRARPDFQP